LVDRYPALIARVANAEDVAATIRLARDHDLPHTVRGGGHAVAGNAVCDSGVVVDLSGMTGVRVDPHRRIAVAQGGVRWGGFDSATHAYRLATTGGLISTTGIAGLTLGGGIGWLMRRYGLACDNLRAAQLVTATGELVRASVDENPDLWWALRGGGGNFGVVTLFEYDLHPVDTVVGGLVLHRADMAPDVLAYYAEFCGNAPDELTMLAALLTAPPEPFVPPDLQLRPAIAVAVCFTGEPTTGDRVLAPLRRFGSPAADVVGPMPHVALQSLLDTGAPAGLRNHWKSGCLGALDDTVISVLTEHAARAPTPLCQVHVHQLGGAVAVERSDASAFGHRDAEFALNILATWSDPGGGDLSLTWVREFSGVMQPHTSGVYVNFSATRVWTACGPRTRLTCGPA
jgi:FAD binding domain